MKELNQLENTLRSWTPRRPSGSIKQRLFPKAAAQESELPDPLAWRWLVPAMAVFIVALIVLAKSPHSGLGDPAALLRPTFALSNLDFSTFYASAGQNEHNTLAAASFDWTKGGHSSTTAPLFFEKTGYRE